MIPAQPIVSSGRGVGAKKAVCQIIGLPNNRLSGIHLSRNAYAVVLRSIFPDLIEASAAPDKSYAVNIWAARVLTSRSLDELAARRREGINVWCFVWESTVLPAGAVETCGVMDQVWVPSEFVRSVCIAGGMPAEKVRLVPYFLELPVRGRKRPFPFAPFTVLVSFDGRSSMNRKNVEGAILAFRLAFSARGAKAVKLRIKTRELRPVDQDVLMGWIDGDPRIDLVNETVAEVDDLYDGADVLLHLHRAEGYGRHVIEAQLRGLPVICTAYSGPMDWCDARSTHLVPYRMVSTAVQTEYQYPQGGEWADPSAPNAALHLQSLHLGERVGNYRKRERIQAASRAAADWCAMERSRAAMVAALNALGVWVD